MAKKKIRKTIRIDGKPVSKSFTSKEAAEAWYSALHTKKTMGGHGIILPPTDGLLFKDFAEEFMDLRRKEHPESTWRSDEQRLEDYVLPAIGHLRIEQVTAGHVRSLLGSMVTKLNRSPKTRDRVRALVSSMFSAAINRDEPLVTANPAFGITFEGKRRGSKPPSFLHTTRECVRYLKAARELSPLHYAIGALGLMGGLRKQEMIPLKRKHLDFDSHAMEISERYIQAAGKVSRGTKAGTDAIRFVPMSEDLEDALLDVCRDAKPSDLVLREDGAALSPKRIYALNAETCARAGVSVTVHGLRHTFGREFAERSGNINALKDILGHSNIVMTQVYSELGKERLKGFRNTVSYKADT